MQGTKEPNEHES